MEVETYRIPTEQELKRFLELNNIAPMGVNNTGNITLISNEDFGTVKLTYITVDANDVINHGKSSYRIQGKRTPLEALLSSQYGLTVLLIVINNEEIIAKAHKILIQNTNGENLIVYTNNKRHIIVVTGCLFDLEKSIFHHGDVTIYDNNGIMIFKKKL